MTAASIAFGVIVIVVHLALNDGNHAKMIEDNIRVQSGHVAVYGEGFRNERTLEQYLHFDQEIEQRILELEGVEKVAPRMLAAGLVAADTRALPTGLLGVDPSREGAVSRVPTMLSAGRFVEEGDRGAVVLGGRLARNLDVEVGETVLLYSVAYTLRPAYELFEVVGILDLPSVSQDRRLAIVSLQDAQRFFEYGDRVTEIAVLARDASWTDAVARELGGVSWPEHQPPVEIQTWYELNPNLVRILIMDDNGMYMLLGILMLVVAFGILNAVLMSVLERERDFKILSSIGMSRKDLGTTVVLECLLQCGLGLLAGFAIAVPTVLWLSAHPIPVGGDAGEMMKFFGAEPIYMFKLQTSQLVAGLVTVAVIGLFASALPALRAARVDPAAQLGHR